VSPKHRSKYQSERAGREQLDILAKAKFGVGKRWTANAQQTFRADGSVRDDMYQEGLIESLAHADELTHLSNEVNATHARLPRKHALMFLTGPGNGNQTKLPPRTQPRLIKKLHHLQRYTNRS